jgi:DNA repair exonuclease SbcCD ATPase subunit
MNYESEIIKAKETLLSLKAEKRAKEILLEDNKSTRLEQETFVGNAEKARAIFQEVASEMQKNLEFQISNIVTMALTAIGFNYEFKVRFVERRNQKECDLLFIKEGNEIEDPLEESGLGACDITSIALRMAIWSIRKTRAIQILDEPSRNLSRDMQAKCSEVLSMLSKELGIQIIAVSHIPEMITAADKIIDVDNVDGYSVVRII